MEPFDVPPTVTIRDDVFGGDTDWRTLSEYETELRGMGFAVLTPQSELAAEALRSVQRIFGLVAEDGRILTEEQVMDAYEDLYTPNYVHDVEQLPGIGAAIVLDTKGVTFPDMGRTMLRLITEALVARGVRATIAYYVPEDWAGARG